MPLPVAEWTAALDRMTAALDEARAALDRHQAEWSGLIDHPVTTTSPEPLLHRLEERLAHWDARLREADELAETVERELLERERAVNRWSDVFARWRELLERGMNPATGPAPDAGAISSTG
jgi:hypothetical protein